MPVLICFLQKIIIPEGYREIIGDRVKGGVREKITELMSSV